MQRIILKKHCGANSRVLGWRKSMKHLLAILMGISCSSPMSGQRIPFVLPETEKTITIGLSNPEKQTHLGGVAYRLLDVAVSDRHFRIPIKNGSVRIYPQREMRDQQGIWADVPGLHLHESGQFLSATYGDVGRLHTLLFFFNEAGSGFSPTFVLGFSDGGAPYRVLERGEFWVREFKATANGTALIIGKSVLSQPIAMGKGSPDNPSYATTYDPYSVFVVRPGHAAIYSLEESREYNLKHYVWAGPHSREDYAVFYNIPGHSKPFGAPATETDALLKSTGKSARK